MRIIALAAVVLVASLAVAAPPAPPPPQPVLAAPIERRLHSDNIDASSFLWNDWNKFVENYHPNYVADDDPATAWVEGAPGSGEGQWLRIQVTPLDHTTKVRLHVRNGYQKSKDLFKANARAKAVTLRLLPSKIEQQVTLADKDGWQDLVIEQPGGVVRTVELAITEVYEGTKYEDLCISDVQVFATSLTPDNPAFEKSKRQTLMAWRADRLAAARLFKAQKVQLPLYPAYEVAATDVELQGYGIAEMIEAAAKDPRFGKEWKDALAIAAVVAKDFDVLPRAQIAPAMPDKLVAADGLQITRVRDVAGEGEGYYDEGALRLPMLDYVSTLFADQLRMLDVKDTKTVSTFLDEPTLCKSDVTWVSRSQPKEQAGPARVQAIVVGRCAKVPAREGSYNAHAIELYVYDAAGRLALSTGTGHIDGYRWVTDHDRAMLAGGSALSRRASGSRRRSERPSRRSDGRDRTTGKRVGRGCRRCTPSERVARPRRVRDRRRAGGVQRGVQRSGRAAGARGVRAAPGLAGAPARRHAADRARDRGGRAARRQRLRALPRRDRQRVGGEPARARVDQRDLPARVHGAAARVVRQLPRAADHAAGRPVRRARGRLRDLPRPRRRDRQRAQAAGLAARHRRRSGVRLAGVLRRLSPVHVPGADPRGQGHADDGAPDADHGRVVSRRAVRGAAGRLHDVPRLAPQPRVRWRPRSRHARGRARGDVVPARRQGRLKRQGRPD